MTTTPVSLAKTEPAPVLPRASSPAKDAAAGADFAAALQAARPVSAPVDAKGPQGGEPGDLQQFEGFVLRIFVEQMLPKSESGFFGGGTAGGIWRSMMAEQLGDQLAAGGGIGLADLLAGGPADARSALAEAKAEKQAGDAAISRAR